MNSALCAPLERQTANHTLPPLVESTFAVPLTVCWRASHLKARRSIWPVFGGLREQSTSSQTTCSPALTQMCQPAKNAKCFQLSSWCEALSLGPLPLPCGLTMPREQGITVALSCLKVLLVWCPIQRGLFSLPPGLRKNQRLAAPLVTPTTKSDVHDELISERDILQNGIMTEKDWSICKAKALELFAFGQKIGNLFVSTRFHKPFLIRQITQTTLLYCLILGHY